MNYYTLSLKSGKEYKLRLTARGQRDYIKETGKGLISSFEEFMDSPGLYLPTLIWASAQQFNHKFTKSDADDIYDQLIDDGTMLEDQLLIYQDILAVSGFFDQEDLESMRKDLKRETGNE